MRVALVHDWLTGMRGGEKVLEEIASLFPESPLFTLLHVPGSVSPALESHPIETSFIQRLPGAARHYRTYLPLFPAAIERLDLAGFDLVVSSSHCAAKGVIPPPGSFHVCYCHTPMRYAWDQETVYFPRRHGPVAWARRVALARLRRWDAATASRVDLFLANSTFVAGRIRRYYGRDSEVLHPPVDVEFFTPGAGAEGDYCLMVAALVPYKRIELAVEACGRLGIELRVVGEGPDRERLERLGDAVRFLGRVDGVTLRALYRGARAFLQPGLEDFGISSVEALACGCPVVALGHGGVVDIVEDGVHGVLYEGDGGAGPLAAAIDKARKIGFNELNLRDRAGGFSGLRFRERFQDLLAAHHRSGGITP